jgi:hypothetical protein
MDILEQFVLPQLQELQTNILFQQDGAPPHCHIGLVLQDIFLFDILLGVGLVETGQSLGYRGPKI